MSAPAPAATPTIPQDPELLCPICPQRMLGERRLIAHFVDAHLMNPDVAKRRAAEVLADPTMHVVPARPVRGAMPPRTEDRAPARPVRPAPPPLATVAAPKVGVGAARCKRCGAPFERQHGRQVYCLDCRGRGGSRDKTRAVEPAPKAATPKAPTAARCGYCHRPKKKHKPGCPRATKRRMGRPPGPRRPAGVAGSNHEQYDLVDRIRAIKAQQRALETELDAIRAALDEDLRRPGPR